MPDEPTYLTLEEIQQEELRILEAFAAFCEEEGLYYSLAGGTLLGAIRHKGFIPWDDDIDVSMPRHDYDQLFKMRSEFEEKTGLKIVQYGRSKDCVPLFKVVNPKIRVSYPMGKPSEKYHLWIDVIPIDGIEGTPEEIAHMYSIVCQLRRILTISESRWSLGIISFLTFVRACISPFVLAFGIDKFCARKIENLARKADFDSAEKVACITWGLYGAGEAMDKQGYLTPCEVEFCGKTFKSLSCWDEYLSGIYGNYMQLPPEDKRIKHCNKAWRVNQS